MIIKLNNHNKAILDKYKDVCFEHDKVLPVITNQKMNDCLKELGELAGIDKKSICNALSLGTPAQVVMKWTAHSDYKA